MSNQSNDDSMPLPTVMTEATESQAAPSERIRGPLAILARPYVAIIVVLAVFALLVLAAYAVITSGRAPGVLSNSSDSSVDTGTALGGVPAADFSLTDQFGQKHQLSDFRGKVVVLAFIDSRCTDTCPLTAETLRLAMDKLGTQASKVQLLAVNANPVATSVGDVRSWSDAHEMTNRWLFLTAPADQLKPIWKTYGVASEVGPNGDVTHTPAVYVIDQAGHEQYLFLDSSDPGSVTAQVRVLDGKLSKLISSY